MWHRHTQHHSQPTVDAEIWRETLQNVCSQTQDTVQIPGPGELLPLLYFQIEDLYEDFHVIGRYLWYI